MEAEILTSEETQESENTNMDSLIQNEIQVSFNSLRSEFEYLDMKLKMQLKQVLNL